MKAFVLRLNPGFESRTQENISEKRISIGWSEASDLSNLNLNWIEFREIVHKLYYVDKDNYRASGNAAGSLWRFIRDMQIGDLVLIPTSNSSFYIAKISGNIEYLSQKKDSDTAFSRKVEFLNNSLPIKREYANSGIISRLKVYQTCVECTDLINDIQSLLNEIDSGRVVSFEEDLRRNVIKTILNEIKNGKIDNFGFEKLLKNLFIKLGAKNCEIIPRKIDKGSDLIAEFYIANILPISISIQAKHWQNYNPVERKEIEQLEKGMIADGTNFGIFITSGVYSEDCLNYVENLNKLLPKLYLIDGLELSNLLFLESVFDKN